jgi:hypothetical protein
MIILEETAIRCVVADERLLVLGGISEETGLFTL